MTSWRKLREQIACSAGQSTLSFGENVVDNSVNDINTVSSPSSFPASPFIKWAGGKGWAVSLLSALAPAKIERYFEPFVGAGAFFFHLMSERKLSLTAHISDINADLINAYTAIRDDHVRLIELLRQHEAPLTELLRRPADDPIRKDHNNYYYRLRDNNYNTKNSTGMQRAAQLIALNKTCYNGLYRVNPKGHFNVPIGEFKKPPTIYDSNKLLNVSQVLRSPNVTIRVCDYRQILDEVKPGDFIYLDPPYHAISDTAYFTGYTVKNFLEGEQKQLAEVFKQLDEMRCNVMLTNSPTPLIRDLYSDFVIVEAGSKRSINSNAGKRSGHTDLIIRNYNNNNN